MATGKKTGGRTKGTPNKLTKELRSFLKELVQKELNAAPALIKNLEGKDRLDVLIKLLPFVLPKKLDRKVAKDQEGKEPQNVTFVIDYGD